MRRERLYLTDILEASDAISTFLGGCSKDAFFESELVRSAVLHKLTVIGEAAARLPGDLRLRHPEVPWSDVVGFRNIAVHAYFAVEWSIVWVAASEEVPKLRQQIVAILEGEPEVPQL